MARAEGLGSALLRRSCRALPSLWSSQCTVLLPLPPVDTVL